MAKQGKKRKPGELPSGNFRKQVVVGYDKSGKRIVKSFTAKTMWEAEKMAAEYKSRHGVGCAPEEMTVAAAVDKFINSRRDIIAPATLNGYEIILNHRLQDIMDIRLGELNILDVQAAVNSDYREKGSSRKTLRSAVSLINSALAAQGYDLALAKRITLPAPKTRKPDLPSAEAVIAAIQGEPFELACLLAMWLSLRISEVRGLKFSDISKEGSFVTVMRTKVFVRGEDNIREHTKTGKSNRTIHLPKYLYDKIAALPHKNDDDFIVSLTYNETSQNFRRAMARRGIRITFHQLRHLFATTASDLGVADEYVQKLGGWASNSILKSVYTHTTAALEERYQGVIDDYWLGLIGEKQSEEGRS